MWIISISAPWMYIFLYRTSLDVFSIKSPHGIPTCKKKMIILRGLLTKRGRVGPKKKKYTHRGGSKSEEQEK